MEFFVAFIQVKDYASVKPILIKFKEEIKDQGEIQVISTIESTYDFILNSFIEKAGAIRKGR